MRWLGLVLLGSMSICCSLLVRFDEQPCDSFGQCLTGHKCINGRCVAAEEGASDAALVREDAGTDAGMSDGMDAGTDAGVDGGVEAIFDNFNTQTVARGTPNPTRFIITRAYLITSVLTYHYLGSRPGTLALAQDRGPSYGPWNAVTFSMWVWRVEPNVVIPAGAYTVVDSSPGDWSYNDASGGSGFAQIKGIPR